MPDDGGPHGFRNVSLAQAPEGWSGGPAPEIFDIIDCKCCNLSYSVASFVPAAIAIVT